jgi:hypothetical protein
MTRLMPSIAQPLAPAIARYALESPSQSHLKRVLAANPPLLNSVLDQLASDPRHADLILALHSSDKAQTNVPGWQPKLIASAVAAGDFQRAFKLWRQFAPVAETNRGLFDFEAGAMPSPFSWTLAQNPAGIAEPEGRGLRIQFTGAEDITFATKTALLTPGKYLLQLQVLGSVAAPAVVRWSVVCLPDLHELASLPISKTGTNVAQFTVGSGCGAVRLELKGLAQTYPQPLEFTITSLKIDRVQV